MYTIFQSSLVFGGLQLICAGDYLQLQAVSNQLYSDPGLPAYMSPAWEKCMYHNVVLKDVVRQDEPEFIQVKQSNLTTSQSLPYYPEFNDF